MQDASLRQPLKPDALSAEFTGIAGLLQQTHSADPNIVIVVDYQNSNYFPFQFVHCRSQRLRGCASSAKRLLTRSIQSCLKCGNPLSA